MTRIFLMAIGILLLSGSVPAAIAQKTKAETVVPVPSGVPTPNPRPSWIPEAQAQPAAPPTATPSQPPIIVQPAPVTVQPAPPPRSETFDWIWSGLLAIIAAIFGIKTVGDWRRPSDLLKSEEIRAMIDERALKLIQSGVPGGIISSAIPGAAMVEPTIRRIVAEMLERRIDGWRSGEKTIDEDDLINRLIERMRNRDRKPPSISSSGQG
jgi:hypothetical protein